MPLSSIGPLSDVPTYLRRYKNWVTGQYSSGDRDRVAPKKTAPGRHHFVQYREMQAMSVAPI